MAGRPSKLTSQLAGRICHIIRLGNYAETAAAHAGIAKSTYFLWVRDAARLENAEEMREGEEYLRWIDNVEKWKAHYGFVPTKEHPEAERPPAPPSLKPKQWEPALLAFSDSVEKSQAEAEVRDLTLIGAAAVEHWQAAAWRRERMAPKRFGIGRGRVSISVDGGEEGDGALPAAGGGEALIIFHIPVNGRERVPPINTEPRWGGKPGETAEAVPAPAPVAPAAPAAPPRRGLRPEDAAAVERARQRKKKGRKSARR